MASTHESKNMSTSSKSTKVDCMICADEVSQRKMVVCPFCKFEACGSCVDRFLMGILDDRPRCMSNSCKKVWSYEFLASQTPPSFHNKRYRDRRATLLHEREKSLLPGTQHLVATEKRRELIKKKIADIMDENAMYRELIKNNDEKIRRLRMDDWKVKEKKERIFTRACPVEDCRGFLSSHHKCGTCGGRACKDCHLPKPKDEEHKCDPDLVATVKLLANDTKPCPACATPIYKIQGCDQMYCTQCHTAFSWMRGTIERGVIHNPHFYEAQRAMNGGHAPRVRGDNLRCGGPPTMWEVNNKLAAGGVQFEFATNAHMLINHINMVELPRYPNMIGEVDNSALRLDYLMGRITEKQWIARLKTKMKKQEKDGEFNMVLSMFTQTMSDLFGNITDGRPENIPNHIVAMIKLREYTNNSLKKIGIRYGNVYPCITPDFKFWANTKTAGKPKKRRIGRREREQQERRAMRAAAVVEQEFVESDGEFDDY